MSDPFKIYHPDTLTPTNKLNDILYGHDHLFEGKLTLKNIELAYDGEATIIGSSDGVKTNFPITVKLKYISLLMKDTLDDVRFYDENDTELTYCYLGRYGDYGYFDVIIPTIPVYPNTTKLKVLTSGPFSDLSSQSDPGSVYPDILEYYPMNYASTILIDRSPNGYDGTIYNAPAQSDGKFMTVINWPGSNKYATAPNHLSGNLTICFWIKTSYTGYTCVNWYNGAGIYDGEVSGTANDFGISLGCGKIMFGVGNPDTTIMSGVIADGTYHFILCTRNSTTGYMTIYVDGSLVASTTGPTGNRNAMSQIYIAKLATSSNYFVGQLEKLMVYNTIKTHDQVGFTPNMPVVGDFELA